MQNNPTRLTVELWDYHSWAMQVQLDHLAGLPDSCYAEPLKSVFASVAEAIRHIYEIDLQWFVRMKPGFELEGETNTVQAAKKSFRELHAEVGNYLLQLEDAEAAVSYRNSKGDVFTNTYAEIIRHLANHGTYHRGNITAMLRQLGYSGASTDYIFFLRNHGGSGQ